MPEDKNFITMLGTGNALAPMLQHVFHAAQQQRCGTDGGCRWRQWGTLTVGTGRNTV